MLGRIGIENAGLFMWTIVSNIGCLDSGPLQPGEFDSYEFNALIKAESDLYID